MGSKARPLIAIDGPAGSGKSTLARRLAEALGLPYINTGLMYRALAHRALGAGVDVDDARALTALLRGMRFDLDSTDSPPSLRIQGRHPGDELTHPEVERRVSQASRHPEVRSLMKVEQRRLGGAGAVMEGRDIGSVVFPEAAVKIFLVAEPAERVARRARERTTGDHAEALARRDARDARVSPLVPATDAELLDTTGKEPDAVVEEALALVRARIGDEQ